MNFRLVLTVSIKMNTCITLANFRENIFMDLYFARTQKLFINRLNCVFLEVFGRSGRYSHAHNVCSDLNFSCHSMQDLFVKSFQFGTAVVEILVINN